jgi:hypothetical protein
MAADECRSTLIENGWLMPSSSAFVGVYQRWCGAPDKQLEFPSIACKTCAVYKPVSVPATNDEWRPFL